MQLSELFRRAALTGAVVLLLSALSACHHDAPVIGFDLYEYDDNPFEANPDTCGVQMSLKIQLPSVDGLRGQKLESVQRIRHTMLSTLLSPYFTQADDPNAALLAYADSIRAEHTSGVLAEIVDLDSVASRFGMQNLSSTAVLTTEDMMVFNCHTEAFTGGIDMMYSDTYLVFDARSGEQVTEELLFGSPNVSPATRGAIQELLLQGLNAKLTDSTLTAGDFSADDVVMNGNFEVKADSLVYHYDPYEIASPAVGPITIAIPNYMLSEYMNPQSVVYRYWFGK